ncbi:MAG: catechol 1,2-dioxygenase [Steroidobacteraceae bacterium]
MGEVVGAGLVSHVPTIMLPESVRLELNEGREISLVPGFHRLRAEVIDQLKPDTVIVFDTHWATLLEFGITAHERRTGRFTSEELPRGMVQVPYDLKGNPGLARLIAEEITTTGVRGTAIDDPCLPIHYGTVNVAHYLNQGEEWLSIGMVMTAGTDDYLQAGAAIGRAIARSDRRVVLLASGSMSHTFYPLRELHRHESSDPAHIFTPAAREADLQRLEWFYQGNHRDVIDTMDEYQQYKPEGRFGHYLMMVAAIGGRDCRALGRRFSDYENAVGTSQVHVWFDRPAGGWTQ